MSRFDSFVIFAEMRTGSNLLEASLNAVQGLTCHGEAFNPKFPGYPDRKELLGVSLDDRVADPWRLLARMRAADGLNGFRFFHDHEPRLVDELIADRRCAKVVLTRNPAESFVSLQIARQTGQWKLRDAKHLKTGQIDFDAAEFEDHLDQLQAFQLRIQHGLQITGQTAFWVDYEDLQDVAVLDGLVRFLGIEAGVEKLADGLVKQNPEPMEAKVANFPAMERAMARLDRFNLSRTPNFEPRRGPGVPQFVAATGAPLLYMPIKGGPVRAVSDWLAGFGGLQGGFTQKTLRQWQKEHPGHRSFTVLSHPVARAHAAFCEHVLTGDYAEIREQLIRHYKLPLPPVAGVGEMTLDEHRAAFLAFVRFLKANLAGQTAIRIDGTWASQTAVLQGQAQFCFPDLVARDETLAQDLAMIAERVGLPAAPRFRATPPERPFALAEVVTPEIEAAVAEAYQRDYQGFGFAERYAPRVAAL
ncbi:sulfotransferase family 2 domain-containing protein [Frigidibacter sp. MR17.14]|uniref:sulfotransferase family 2 domain-containing protein n=1 Tax=Frigidibacter sp. MR17.14 TaxID=3126509 RepID=UPI003012C48D